MWQKSNETDFLLNMNFILFTNEDYPLQNSSLWQLHSDGSVVSIVVSSAGRLLLVYLSARRLRSSGYYLKYQNGALSSGFWPGRIKRSHRDWDPANRGAEERQKNLFWILSKVPKWRPFKWIWAGGIKRSHRDWDPANRGAEEPQKKALLDIIQSTKMVPFQVVFEPGE